jgi:hypothetical protein
MVQAHLTVGEVATLYNLPTWKIRRAVDALGDDIPRAGQYRLVPRTLLGKLALELERRGWLRQSEAAAP